MCHYAAATNSSGQRRLQRVAPSSPAETLPLGACRKPVGILNVEGFFDHLLAFFDHATQEVGTARVKAPLRF